MSKHWLEYEFEEKYAIIIIKNYYIKLFFIKTFPKIFTGSKKTYIIIGTLVGAVLAACIAIPLALKGNGNEESL